MDLKKYSSPSAAVLCIDEQDVLTASTEFGVNWSDTWNKNNNDNEQGMFE